MLARAKMPPDSTGESAEMKERWRVLGAALQSRYQSSAEAFVAFGGRAGFLLKASDINKALRELAVKARQSKPAIVIDVAALMGDIDGMYDGGLTFTQFVDRVAFEVGTGKESRQQLGTLPHNKQGEGLSGVGTQRLMVGTPVSALRGSATPKAHGNSPSPLVIRSQPQNSGVVSVDTSKMNKSRREVHGNVGGALEGQIDHAMQGASPGPGAGRWKGTRDPPPNWMMKQRQLSALQGGNARHLERPVSHEAARTVGVVRMAGKHHLLDSAQQRLYSILGQDPPQAPMPPVTTREVGPAARRQELMSPVMVKDSFVEHNKSTRVEEQQMFQAEDVRYGDAKEGRAHAAERFASKLQALDGAVMEKRLSLAETEKNVLRRERAELQAQLRSQAQQQRQTQERMHEQLQAQLAALCQTFDKVGTSMLNQQPRTQAAHSTGQSADRRMLDQLEKDLEERIKNEILCMCDYGSRQKLVNAMQAFSCVIGVGGQHSSETDQQLGLDLAGKVEESVRGSMGGGVWCYPRLVAARDLHSQESPALAALLAGGIYIPVCSWIQDASGSGGGSIDELCKINALEGEDWVDDFLLEVVIALGIREAFQYPISIMPLWISLDSSNFEAVGPFPIKKLSCLSPKPSIATNVTAIKLLRGAGISVSPRLGRISVRDAISSLADLPGVWTGEPKAAHYQVRGRVLGHVSECIAALAKARSLLPKAREARRMSREAAQNPNIVDQVVENDQDLSFQDDESEGDELSAVWKRELDARRQASKMQNLQNFFEKKRKEDEIHLKADALASEVLQAWAGAIKQLPRPWNEALDIARQELPRQGIDLGEVPRNETLEEVAKEVTTRRQPWEEMRDRKYQELMRHSLYAWNSTCNKAKNAAKLEAKNHLKKLFASLKTRCKESRASREKCLSDYIGKRSEFERVSLLMWAWGRWNEQEDLGSLADGEEINEGRAPDLEESLRRLQQAVVETHNKHSRLLEMHHKEEQLQHLLDRLPPAVSEALTQAGVTSVPELHNIFKVKGDEGLRNLGVEESAHREMLSVLLSDATEGEGGGMANSSPPPDPNSILGARDRMAAEMEALRLKLQMKQSRLAQSVQEMQKEGLAEEPGMSEQEKSLAVVNLVLESLGGQALPLQREVKVRGNWESDDKEGAEVAVEGSKTGNASGRHQVSEGAEDETEGDRQTKKYMEGLRAEGNVHQAVLQLLSEKLGQDKKEEEKQEEDGTDQMKSLIAKQGEMEVALKQAIKVIDKARSLLDQPEGNAGRDQFPQDKRGHSRENDLCTCSFKADGSLKVANELCPVNRDSAEGLADRHTSAEEEAIRLGEEASRRLAHSTALEQENSRLRQQMAPWDQPRRATSPSGQGSDQADIVGDHGEEIHWTSMLSDPALAARYGGGGGYNDGDWGGADKTSTEGIAHDDEQQHGRLSWKLVNVDGGLPISRSDVLDIEIQKRVKDARQRIAGQIEAAQSRIHRLEIERDQRLKDLEDKKMPKISEEKVNEAVAGIASAFEEIRILEDQLDGLDWERELKEMEENGKRLDDEALMSLELAKRRHQADPSDATEAEMKYCEERVVRVKAATQIKIKQREKEVEMVVLALKMQEDDLKLQEEQKRLQSEIEKAQQEEQELLAGKLRSMSETIDTTARGRCRPDVLASLAGVNKLKSAVSRHRLAVDGMKEQERKKADEERQRQTDKIVAQEKKKENEILAKAERKTDEMLHRNRLLKEAEDSLKESKQKLFKDASSALEKTERALQAGSDAAEAELHKMWVRPGKEATTDEEYCALGMLAMAQAFIKDLSGAVTTDDQDKFKNLEEKFKKLDESVGSAAKKLKEEAEASLKDLESVLRKDTKNMVPEVAREIAKVRVSCESSLSKLKEAGSKSRELTALETRLKTTWERGSSAMKTSLKAQLSRGDAELDAALAALHKGALPSASAQLQKAKMAYENAQLVQSIAVGEDAVTK